MKTPIALKAWVVALIVFFAVFFLDLCWAFYVAAVHAAHPLQASIWAVVLFVLAAVATVGYIKHPFLLVPASLGAFLGTYVGVCFGAS